MTVHPAPEQIGHGAGDSRKVRPKPLFFLVLSQNDQSH